MQGQSGEHAQLLWSAEEIDNVADDLIRGTLRVDQQFSLQDGLRKLAKLQALLSAKPDKAPQIEATYGAIMEKAYYAMPKVLGEFLDRMHDADLIHLELQLRGNDTNAKKLAALACNRIDKLSHTGDAHQRDVVYKLKKSTAWTSIATARSEHDKLSRYDKFNTIVLPLLDDIHKGKLEKDTPKAAGTATKLLRALDQLRVAHTAGRSDTKQWVERIDAVIPDLAKSLEGGDTNLRTCGQVKRAIKDVEEQLGNATDNTRRARTILKQWQTPGEIKL